MILGSTQLFKKALGLSLVSAMAISAVAFADNADDRFKVEGVINTDLILPESVDYQDTVRFKGSSIKITAQMAENIKAVLKMKLDREFRVNGSANNPDFDVEDFIEEANIEIRKIGGRPVAVIIGKQQIAFGQHLSKMPVFQNSALHGLFEQKQVFGLTVALDMDFNLFDKLEASFFETKANDLSIGEFDGYSVRLTKNLSKALKVVVSHMDKGNGYNSSLDSEQRTSLGVVYKNPKGGWTAYLEGIYFQGNTTYKLGNYGVEAGMSFKAGPGEVAVETTLIEDSLVQLGIGYVFQVNSELTFGPEIRYVNYSSAMGKKDGFVIGLRLTYKFGPKPKQNKPLFDSNKK